MTDAELAALLQRVAGAIDVAGPREVPALVQPLRDAGLTPDMHTEGGAREMTNRETLEWYGGAILGIVEQEAWFAVNSWLNCCEKFTGGNPVRP